MMNRFWIADSDTKIVSPNGILYKSEYYLTDKIKKQSNILVKNGIYYGSVNNKSCWVKINSNNIKYRSDFNKVILLLYIICWLSRLRVKNDFYKNSKNK